MNENVVYVCTHCLYLKTIYVNSVPYQNYNNQFTVFQKQLNYPLHLEAVLQYNFVTNIRITLNYPLVKDCLFFR